MHMDEKTIEQYQSEPEETKDRVIELVKAIQDPRTISFILAVLQRHISKRAD